MVMERKTKKLPRQQLLECIYGQNFGLSGSRIISEHFVVHLKEGWTLGVMMMMVAKSVIEKLNIYYLMIIIVM